MNDGGAGGAGISAVRVNEGTPGGGGKDAGAIRPDARTSPDERGGGATGGMDAARGRIEPGRGGATLEARGGGTEARGGGGVEARGTGSFGAGSERPEVLALAGGGGGAVSASCTFARTGAGIGKPGRFITRVGSSSSSPPTKNAEASGIESAGGREAELGDGAVGGRKAGAFTVIGRSWGRFSAEGAAEMGRGGASGRPDPSRGGFSSDIGTRG